ncbi:Crp/Fnr family transcriptional regulator [Rivibacter subsaxonicus]|uniref:Cyclic nucleotide-binding protein n=1 Tax=Rivibacter subsaxonicus TaxID=457575 RepID=A0A4Q7W2P0_9BURK|nr:cyclic nucleotide-binding domain-containing protein [Rivibacter subsaxonicus]RZU02969.1 cyclic nucleotide-binding protein [Rivibacter subsaxonicus]
MEPDLISTEFAAWWAALLTTVSAPRGALAVGAEVLAFVLALLGAYARTMVPLRWLAAAAGVASLVYAVLYPAPVTLITAGILLPINVYRVIEITRLTRHVRRACVDADMAGLWLKPYMHALHLQPGQVLFKKGDEADRLYMLVEGEAQLVEIAQAIEPGRIFGEIALFSPEKTRTQSVRALSACTLLEIEASTVKELYYQNPAFGFHMIELLVGRLTTDVHRFERQLAAGQAQPSA